MEEINLSTGIIEVETQTISIVVLGDFNPSIFQPLWFSANQLMPREETENADVSVIHKKIAAFAMGKIQVQVDEERLGLTTVEPSHGPILRDLAVGTLSLLEHTPLRAIGLNVDSVFVVNSDDEWHAIGHRMVPKVRWQTVLDCPGMSQVIVEGKRIDCLAERIQFRVKPFGVRRVSVAANQHYQLDKDGNRDGRARHQDAMRVLRDDWTSFINYARSSSTYLVASDAESVQASAK